MAGLYSQLYLGASALGAHRTGVAASGHNIANVNTPGHTRVGVDLRANAAFIGGVRSLGFSSSADLILHQRERLADAELGRATDLANAASALEGALAIESGTIVDSIASLFGGFAALSSNPTDVALRQSAVSGAEDLANEFNRAAQTLEEARGGADDRLISLAQEANRLSEEIASANRALRTTDDTTLVDRRNQAARELSEIVGGAAHIDNSGSMRFTLSNGAVLVDGDNFATMEATADQTNYGGFVRIDVVSGNRRQDVTASLSEGRMGGELHFRDTVAANMLSDLDQLAYDLATQINAVHRAHAGLDMVSGRDLFIPPSGVAGTAIGLTVDQSILDDPSKLASADPTLGPGDNSGLLALADMSDVKLAGAGQSKTFLDEGLRMMTTLGFTVQRAANDMEVAQLRGDSLASLRDSVSGVSVEEELTRLQAFQRASEASARVISTVDSLIGTLIETL